MNSSCPGRTADAANTSRASTVHATPAPRALPGTAAYFATTVFWGANIPLTAILFETFDPFFLGLLRAALAALVLAAAVALSLGWRQLQPAIPVLRLLVLSGTMAAFFVFYNLGLRYTNTITAAAIMAGAPVYSAITMRVLAGSAVERGFRTALLLTVLGAAIAVWSRSDGAGLRLQGGEALIVLSFVCWT
ncbi:MAG TPA: EamA family transporter, partial [Burkholderiaceae bacterium]|nr:EamA family transporter [Burkholderiaceae bacterium]